MGMLSQLRTMVASCAGPERTVPVRPAGSAPAVVAIRPSLKDRLARGTVGWSHDLERVLALPRRPQPELGVIADELTARLRSPEGTQRLRPVQAWALWEAPIVGGLLAPCGVGSGKTLMGCLMPMVMPGCARAVLLIPPALRVQFLEHDWAFYGRHWKLPNLAGGGDFTVGRPVLHVVSYSELSSPNPRRREILTQIDPDLVICDEVHNLRYPLAARTRRMLRHFANHSATRFCGWSGTLTGSSIADYAHLSALALGEGSPLPVEPPAVKEWAAALDPQDFVFLPGALERLCEPGEPLRAAFRRRLVDTQGVVATSEELLGTSIVFYKRQAPPVPAKIEEYLAQLRRPSEAGGWIRPDREELWDALAVNECARQLACGFYMRWRFPRGEPRELIDEWFERRQAYHRELREKLKLGRIHLDSYALCWNAAQRFYKGGCPGCARGPKQPHERGCLEAEGHPLWSARSWPAWAEVKDTVYHETETVWESDFLLQDIVKWMAEAPGIVWVEHVSMGQRLAKLSGAPYFGGGEEASRSILIETGKRSVVASVDAHRDGKNLQVFNRNLLVTVASSAAQVEQTLGRTHREGQKADEVEAWVYQHTAELEDALAKARAKAEYIHGTLGNPQKLCYGTWSFTV